MMGHAKVWRSNVVQSSSWIGHEVQKVKVWIWIWIWIWYCSDQKVKWVIVSNSLSQFPDPRSIGSISSMIGQAKVIAISKWQMSHIKSITHIITRYVKHTQNKTIISLNEPMSTSCVKTKGLQLTELSTWTINNDSKPNLDSTKQKKKITLMN